jgi:hypothetical protein
VGFKLEVVSWHGNIAIGLIVFERTSTREAMPVLFLNKQIVSTSKLPSTQLSKFTTLAIAGMEASQVTSRWTFESEGALCYLYGTMIFFNLSDGLFHIVNA